MEKIDFLKTAIEDAQNIIRFTDTKAGAVLGFWGVILTGVLMVKDELIYWVFSQEISVDRILIILLLLFMFVWAIKSIWLSFLVLVPKNNPKEHICLDGISFGGLFYLHECNQSITGKHLYFNRLDINLKVTSKDYIDRINKLDKDKIIEELAIELQKISFIRNLKVARVNVCLESVRNFFLAAILLMLYWMLSNFASNTGGVLVSTFKISAELFIVLYIGHKIADYLFQTDNQAKLKGSDYVVLFVHSFLYTVIVLGLAYFVTGYFNWSSIILLFISHMFIDSRKLIKWWTSNIKKIPPENVDEHLLLELDQAFHYLILFVISISYA